MGQKKRKRELDSEIYNARLKYRLNSRVIDLPEMRPRVCPVISGIRVEVYVVNGAFAWCVTAVMRSDRFDCQWRTAPEMSRRRRRTLDLFQNVDARGVGRWWGRRVVATAVATM